MVHPATLVKHYRCHGETDGLGCVIFMGRSGSGSGSGANVHSSASLVECAGGRETCTSHGQSTTSVSHASVLVLLLLLLLIRMDSRTIMPHRILQLVVRLKWVCPVSQCLVALVDWSKLRRSAGACGDLAMTMVVCTAVAEGKEWDGAEVSNLALLVS